MDKLNERLNEIRCELEKEDITSEEIRALNDEVDSIEEQRKTLIVNAEKRNETLQKVVEMKRVKEEIKEEGEERKMEEKNIFASAEYRSAYLKNLMGKELTAEERTMTTANKGIATITANKIVDALRNVSPVIEDIDLYYSNGYLKVFAKRTFGSASVANEGADLTSQDITLAEVELTPKRITEFMRISGSLNDMSIDDFETKMVEDIAGGIAKLIENKIYTVMNSINTTVEGTVTEANIFELYGALKTSYAKNAKFYMNRATKAQVMSVSNKSKNDLYLDNKILGTVVEETDQLEDGVIIYGYAKKICGVLSKELTIENARTLHNDSYEWLGVAMFDVAMGIPEAFVKLAPAVTESE